MCRERNGGGEKGEGGRGGRRGGRRGEGKGEKRKKESTLSYPERRTGQSRLSPCKHYRLFPDIKKQPDLSFAIAAVFSTFL